MLAINHQHGFTLFEALIYIALFSIIIGGGVLSALAMMQSTARLDVATKQEVELNFLLRKIDWMLGDSTVAEPMVDATRSYLRVNNGSNVKLDVDADGNASFIDNGTEYQLTDVLYIDSIKFQRFSGLPQTLEVRLTVNGETLTPLTYYVRD